MSDSTISEKKGGIPVAKSWFRAWFLLCLIPASQPVFAQEEVPASSRKDCLSVELVMYSGRPRPRFLICDEVEVKDLLGILEAAREKPLDSTSYPAMEGTPSYQGLLLTPPGKQGEARSRILIRKGFMKPLGGSRKLRVDQDRTMEMQILKRAKMEKDISKSPTEGEDLGPLSESILAQIQRESDTR